MYQEQPTSLTEQAEQRPAHLVDIPGGLLKALLPSPDRSPSATMGAHRHEIKMVTEHWHLHDVESWIRLHRAAFLPTYPQRQVNNIYFDTPDLSSVVENLAGMAERRKLRLRWYGDEWTAVEGILEHKCKRDLAGWKIQYPLTTQKDLTRMSWSDLVKSIEDDVNDELKHQLRMKWRPILINSYQRRYYISANQKVRATVDFAGVCYDQRFSAYPNISRPSPGQSLIILEVKASVDDRNELADVVSDFPLRVGKHSKYITALEESLGHG